MVYPCEPPQVEHEGVEVAYRRQPTPMVIVDSNLRTIAQSFQLDISELNVRLRRLVERHIVQRTTATQTTVEILDAQTALRVADLSGEDGAYFAITFERCGQERDAIEDVATEHHLSNRERQVFRMLLAGATDGDVSEQLVIARTTASDHAKNILRKTGANKRTELFARVIKCAGSR